ncbi:MutS protein 5 [Thecamonas trahens ATCC 50062]|uniref:DNA mismatch repair protein MSH5 n=1 Tax=Thecamonas trahens ATCC 50062 TaxID=461836 RepID=A0A0L0DKK4_THETB|nr:MutS protein 5 [Thecamonas trahens ATCC 50062]KNC52760.1 MutS protein 5 [Thecamonas trahens ATCC 50062]|eukprot:XP_013755073.1 MutS protein 5 [Thecamonas trahens ATCC 50062]
MAARNVLAVFVAKKQLGVAWYSWRDDRVSVGSRYVGDASECGAVLGMVVRQSDPDVVLSCAQGLPGEVTLSAVLAEVYGTPRAALMEGDEGGVRAPAATLVRAGEFGYDAALHRVSLVEVRGEGAVVVETDKVAQMRALGGLLGHLLNMQPRGAASVMGALPRVALDNDDRQSGRSGHASLTVAAVVTVPLAATMVVDALSLAGLQIFDREAHPSLTGVGSSKEGLSLFGVMDFTKSGPGRRELKSWFLSPTMDVVKLRNRLNAVALLRMPAHGDVLSEMRKALAHIRDVPRLLAQLEGVGMVRVSEWRDLLASALYGVRLVQLVTPLASFDGTTFFSEAAAAVDAGALADAAELIRSVVDFDGSLDAGGAEGNGRVVVHCGVNSELDAIRSQYNGLPEFLTRVAQQEMENVPEALVSSLTITYVPQLGYMVLFPIEAEGGLRSGMHIPLPGYEFLFATQSHRYYKNETTRTLDAEVGDVYSKMLDLERMVFRLLAAKLTAGGSAMAAALGALSAHAASLDCVASLAVAAGEFSLTRPVVTRDNVLEVSGGRHILQELCVPTFVANDVALGGAAPRVGVVTGANYSGKSVFIKQAGLIVYLAHIGSFVPATAAVVGVTDRIFTRLISRETVTLAQSAFMIDLQQLSVMVAQATSRSLLLLDEFGKGTEALDGAALVGAFVGYVAGGGCGSPPPRTLLSTHFHELFAGDGALLPAPSTVSYLHMGVVTSETGDDGTELVFLYQVKPGRADASLARACAARAGMPDEVLVRAAEWTAALERGELEEKLAADEIHAQTWASLAELHTAVERVGDGELSETELGELYQLVVERLA